ncbi:hypothetical protein IAT38_008286 [Cryptococcus sp. DSM 104549]
MSSPSTPRPPPHGHNSVVTPTPHRSAPTSVGRNGTLLPEGQTTGIDGKKGSTTEQRRARREQLRNFYGIRGDAAKSGGNALDIDSPTFSPTVYYEDLISKSDLGGLMKASSSLSSAQHVFKDVLHLEGSRHSLVYNHHHQLFAAGDTISHLNSRTPQLLSIVTNLQQSFSSISQLADSVALPETPPIAGEGLKRDRMSPQRRKAILAEQRLKLMVGAEYNPDEIRAFFKTFASELEELADSDKAEKSRLVRCRALLDSIP